jgi:cysteinyl-tRNA synthetase
VDLKLYDTLSREKRLFAPIDASRVGMYVCGPTVYDFAHIGNARPVIVFDVLFRLLRHLYGEAHVKYVRNITDVEDKINARAAERGIQIRELTEGTYTNYREDVTALGCLPPTVEPRATEHIEEMKTLIERLIASGNAYVAEEHVLFSVPSMPDYGKLSKRSLDEMVAGARVDVAPYKRGDMDFVLWKPSKGGEPGWTSPAGIKTPGRPGLAYRMLGDELETSRRDLRHPWRRHRPRVPHHENEIAQSRCAFHTGVMANYWMHNGFLQVEGEKMSKSLGNFFTIREVLADWQGDVIRLAMLSTHYRQPINWTVKGLEEAEKALASFFDAASADADARPAQGVLEALADDLNTPQAISEMHALRNAAAARRSPARSRSSASRQRLLGMARGACTGTPRSRRRRSTAVSRRGSTPRRQKNFAEADRIRDELRRAGEVLKDPRTARPGSWRDDGSGASVIRAAAGS